MTGPNLLSGALLVLAVYGIITGWTRRWGQLEYVAAILTALIGVVAIDVVIEDSDYWIPFIIFAMLVFAFATALFSGVFLHLIVSAILRKLGK